MKKEDLRQGMKVKIMNKTCPKSWSLEKWMSETGNKIGAFGKIDCIQRDHVDVSTENRTNVSYGFLPEDLEPIDPNETFFLRYKEEK